MFDRLDSACLRLVYSRSYYIAFCNLNCLHIIKKKRRRVDSLSFHKAVEALDGKQQRALTDDNPRRVYPPRVYLPMAPALVVVSAVPWRLRELNPIALRPSCS